MSRLSHESVMFIEYVMCLPMSSLLFAHAKNDRIKLFTYYTSTTVLKAKRASNSSAVRALKYICTWGTAMSYDSH